MEFESESIQLHLEFPEISGRSLSQLWEFGTKKGRPLKQHTWAPTSSNSSTLSVIVHVISTPRWMYKYNQFEPWDGMSMGENIGRP